MTLAATVVALLVGLAGSAAFVLTLRSALERGLVSSAQEEVSEVRAQLEQGESPARAVVSGRNDIVIQVLQGGRVVAGDHPQIPAPLARGPGVSREVRVAGLADEYVVVARTGTAPGSFIVVGRSTEQVASATVTTVVLLGVAAPLGLLLLAITVWASLGRALRPVEAMRREAAEITSEHLERRLLVPRGDDEIPRLASTLNVMLDDIDASHRAQRQFVSDASHELRSPLATLRQLAEVALLHPGLGARPDAADDAGTAGLARDVLAEEQRMEELVTALLLLARLDDAGSAGPPEPVDLDDLVLAEVRRTRGVRGRVTVDASHVNAGQVGGDPVLLSQVVANLVSNARRHAAARVRVAVSEQRGEVRLVVEDDGAGIPEAQRERVFDRFVRLDEARARDGGGSGLGLAIVAKIVERLGGRVRAEAAEIGGARFVVDLPGWESRG